MPAGPLATEITDPDDPRLDDFRELTTAGPTAPVGAGW